MDEFLDNCKNDRIRSRVQARHVCTGRLVAMTLAFITAPGHAANMRDGRAKRLGVGVAAWGHGDRNYYKIVQVFGDDCRPASAGPRPPLGKR